MDIKQQFPLRLPSDLYKKISEDAYCQDLSNNQLIVSILKDQYICLDQKRTYIYYRDQNGLTWESFAANHRVTLDQVKSMLHDLGVLSSHAEYVKDNICPQHKNKEECLSYVEHSYRPIPGLDF